MQEKYEVSSMAQTRAVSKVCRIALSWIMTMAGYEATPAEEITEPVTEPQVEHKQHETVEQTKQEMLTEFQQKKIYALYDKTGFTKEERRNFAITVIGRQINSIRELTKDEASKLIDALQEFLNKKGGKNEVVTDGSTGF